MSESSICSQATILLDEIRPLKKDFDDAYALFARTKDPSLKLSLGYQQNVLTTKLDVLKRLLWWQLEVEQRLDLRKQYEAQLSHLRRAGILCRTYSVSSKESVECVTGIDGNAYPPPSFEEIHAHIKGQQERLQPKLEQGYRKMLLVPFATNVGGMINNMSRYLRGGKTASGKAFVIDPSCPIKVHNDHYELVATEHKIIYKQLRPELPTSTKHWSLVQQVRSQAWDKGWHVVFVKEGEDGQGIEPVSLLEQREQGESLESLSKAFGTKGSLRYGEKGMTPEEWIVAFITHLEETGDFLDAGPKAVALAGAHFPKSDSVPCVRSTAADINMVHFGDIKMKDVDQYAIRTVVRV